MAAPLICADELRKLYDAIMALTTGQQATSIGFGERSVSYSKTDLGALMKLWTLWYRVCGTDSGLPDLAAATQRGAPACVRISD